MPQGSLRNCSSGLVRFATPIALEEAVEEAVGRPTDPVDAGYAEEVVTVLAQAFRGYPVLRHVLGPEGEGDADRRTLLVRFFVTARLLRGEPLLGLPDPRTGGLGAAALVSFPAVEAAPPALDPVRRELWALLGDAARERYEACGAVWARFPLPSPRIHLNMIGVLPELRGSGLGGRLLREVHGMARSTGGGHGVSLTTEDPANVPLYLRFGYRVVEHAVIAPGLETWGFYRPPAEDP